MSTTYRKMKSLQGSTVSISNANGVITITKSSDTWLQVTRTDLLTALGAVDAPVEVPKKLGAVVRGAAGGLYFLINDSGNSQLWTDKFGSWYLDYEIAKLVTNGGTILSEGVEQ